MRSDVTVMFREKCVMGGGSRGQLSVIQKMQVGTDLFTHTFLPFPTFITPAPGWEKRLRTAMSVKSEPGMKEVSILLPESSCAKLR